MSKLNSKLVVGNKVIVKENEKAKKAKNSKATISDRLDYIIELLEKKVSRGIE